MAATSVTINNKLSFEEHINNICKTANKKLNALSRISHYMKQNQKELLLSSFTISHFSYCPLIWMFCSNKSTKKINAFHEGSQRIILNDYESPYSLLLEEAHQITIHQRCIRSLMTKVYRYLNGHLPDIMNIFKLSKNMYNLRNFHTFQTKNPLSLKYRLDIIPYRAVLFQVPIDIRETAFLALFKNRIKTWKYEHCPCRSCKIYIQNVGYI